MLDIDGSYGEGGGQLVRLAVALSAITGAAVRVTNIRARRDNPGLAPQHVAGVRAVGELCNARITGLELRSPTITFEPRTLRGGEFHFDIGTAGSVTLVMQALLPVMLATHARCAVRLTGGTDVRQAPPADYVREVLLGLLARLGARVEMRIPRRGYYPRGGGAIEIAVAPTKLAVTHFDTAGRAAAVRGSVRIANLPEHIAARMRQAAIGRLAAQNVAASIDTELLGPDDADGPGGGITCWAECERSVLGAARVAERGVRAETLGAAVGAELAADLAAGAALDVHAADQLPVYLALAGAGSFTTRRLSLHARTALWLVERCLPVSFAVSETAGLARVAVAHRSGARA